MDATDLALLLRSLATTPCRRAVARALAGSALAGLLPPLLDLTETDAKRNKKKRRRKKRRQKEQPFCAGNNTCVAASPNCDDGSGSLQCTCFVTVEGKPFCGLPFRIDTCSGCLEGETCIDISGSICGGTTACAPPCANPL